MENQVVAETPPVTGAASGTPPAQTPVPQIFVDATGNLLTGWRDTYVPEDIRSDKVFDGVRDISSLTKMLAHAERTIRRQGKAMPEDTAPQSDWDVYYRSIGRPDAPDGYKYEIPKGFEDYYDLTLIKEAQTEFHKAGLNPKQFITAFNLYHKWLADGVKARADANQEKFEEAERIIEEEEGTAVDSHTHLCNRIISENTQGWPEDRKEKLLEILNESPARPYVRAFLINVAGKFMEHRIIPESEFLGGKTPKQVEGEITELKATPGFILADKEGKLLKNYDRDGYNRLVEKLHGLEDELRAMTKK